MLVQVIIINILSSIACVPTVDSNIIVEDLVEQVIDLKSYFISINSLHQSKSPSRKVQLQVLKALLTIGKVILVIFLLLLLIFARCARWILCG